MRIITYRTEYHNNLNLVERASDLYGSLPNLDFLFILRLSSESVSVWTDHFALGRPRYVSDLILRGKSEGELHGTKITHARALECEQKRIEDLVKGARLKTISPSKVKSELLRIIDVPNAVQARI